MRGEIVLQSPMDSSEGSIVSLGPEDSHLSKACWTPAIKCFGKLLVDESIHCHTARRVMLWPNGRAIPSRKQDSLRQRASKTTTCRFHGRNQWQRELKENSGIQLSLSSQTVTQHQKWSCALWGQNGSRMKTPTREMKFRTTNQKRNGRSERMSGHLPDPNRENARTTCKSTVFSPHDYHNTQPGKTLNSTRDKTQQLQCARRFDKCHVSALSALSKKQSANHW